MNKTEHINKENLYSNFTNRIGLRLAMVSILTATTMSLLVSGCASRYTITTNRGYKITAKGKPRYDKSSAAWIYKDGEGVTRSISAGAVNEVSPESMSGDSQSAPKFNSSVKR
jgi:hypothetical protein